MIINADCLEWMRAQPGPVCDLCFTSPPYEDCRTYGIGFKLKGQAWVDWMIPRVVAMCRVTDGLVFINAAGKVSQFKYRPVVEWLVADLTRHHGLVCGPAPYVFHRVGIPGSGGPHYHRRDWEPVYSFARPEVLPLKWSDNTAMGKPRKYGPGGPMSNRGVDGSRKTDRKVMSRPRHGSRDNGTYSIPAVANPGNVIRCKVGGGQMGSALAHENQAPFPESLASWFVRSYCPPDGTVMDPFGGSGTVAAVATTLGRKYIAIDIRESQCDLMRRRVSGRQMELV